MCVCVCVFVYILEYYNATCDAYVFGDIEKREVAGAERRRGEVRREVS